MELARYVEVLRRGGVVACPTETFVGLLADATDAAAVSRVAKMKGRPTDAPIAVLVPDADAVELVAEPLSVAARMLAGRYWPGALTLVLWARSDAPALLVKDGKIGVRVPGPSPALNLVRAFGGPLTATSANLTGAPAPVDTEDLVAELAAQLDAVLVGRSPGGVPSTVLDVTVSPPAVLRAGAVEPEK